MALHKDLPIYATAYRLLLRAVDHAGGMPRAFKPIFGKSLGDIGMAMILQIRTANISRNKVPHLEVLLERIAEFETLLRVFLEKRWISQKQWAETVELVESVGKQATKWKQHHAASPVT